MDQRLIHSLVSHIYDAALDPGRWPAALEGISRALGATAVNITIMDRQGLPQSMLAYGIPPECENLFLNKYTKLELNPGARATLALPVGTLLKSWTDLDMARFADCEMYHDLYRPLDALHTVGGVMARGGEYNIGLGILLPHDRPELTQEELDATAILVQHLQRALQVFLRIEAAEHENRLSCEALDRVGSVGVVVVDESGRVLLANARAREIASRRDGFAIGPNGVSAATQDLTAHLQRAIATAAQTGADGGLSTGATIRLARPSGRRPLLAIVSLVGAAEWSLLARRPAAIVLICDPEREELLPPKRLSHLFGLTRREAEIAALLAQGAGLVEAADRLGLSRGTVHTHLKRILEKTDTHRQAELVSLLLRTLAGLGH